MYGLEEEDVEEEPVPPKPSPVKVVEKFWGLEEEASEEEPDEHYESSLNQRRTQYLLLDSRQQATSESESEEHRHDKTEWQRQRRLNETVLETWQRQKADAERKERHRLNETPEEIEQRRKVHAEQERQYRQNKTPEETEQRRKVHAEQERQYRLNETPEQTHRRRTEDFHRHRALRRRDDREEVPSHGEALTFDNIFPEVSDIGLMNIICRHCFAFHFKGELATQKTDEFIQCCHNGEVILPNFKKYPDDLKMLLTGKDQVAHNFHKNIRSYNSALAFASLGAKIDVPAGRGPYCFKIHGQIYHRISSAHPDSDQKASYGQLYFLDSAEAFEERKSNKANEGCMEDVLRQLDKLIRKISPHAKAYKFLHEVEEEEIACAKREKRETYNFLMVFDTDRNLDRRRYNIPRANEIAAIIVDRKDNSNLPSHEVIVHLRGGQLMNIPVISELCDPLTYPLLFPGGDEGWHPNIKKVCPNEDDNHPTSSKVKKDKNISMLQFYAFRIAHRRDERNFNPILYAGKLFQQYLVDAYVKVEETRLNFQRYNQKTLRAESYRGLTDYLASAAEQQHLPPGKVVILSSSFPGSPRAMQQSYQDAMAICRKFGKPDIFLTFTCNPKWKEITRELFPGQTPSDRPDIVGKVFKMKLQELLKDLLKRDIFGKINGYTWVIEFQKRGLPHCHMLLILHEQDKPREPDAVDKIVHAEIPNQAKYPRLYEAVRSHMIHGPCGTLNPNCPCMETLEGTDIKTCSKDFPKKMVTETSLNVNGYPQYRRREKGRTVKVGQHKADNQWVVPFNPYLLLKYDAHINVEICSTVKSFKYLYKYIFKGHDCARIRFKQQVVDWDEISEYVETRYISAPEAFWHLSAYTMDKKSHAIVRLPVHLPDEQPIYFQEGEEEAAAKAAQEKNTLLTAWFKLNQKDATAHNLLYHDIPIHYTFHHATSSWRKRQKTIPVIGRMYSVSPSDQERYHLRLLLLHTPGAKSFEDLRKVNGAVCTTFKQTAHERGLLKTDEEWRKCMEEAVTFQMPFELRQLFATILVFGIPADALNLWEGFKADLMEDYRRSYNANASEALAYTSINEKLNVHGKSLADFEIYLPLGVNLSLEEQETIDQRKETRIGQEMYEQLNESQKEAADKIMAAVSLKVPRQNENCFFIDGPGGTGKTFLYCTLYHLLKSQGKNAIMMAWTGIAATLLPGGRTVHSQFKLPLRLFENSTSNLDPNTLQAEIIRDSAIICWDEAPMAPNCALHAIDIVLRDIMQIKRPFGGKIMVLGGDFRQVLPVIRFASPSTLIAASIKSSKLWPLFNILRLQQNMRTGPGEQAFSNWLLQLGNGELESIQGEIELPASCLTEGNIIDEIFGEDVNLLNIEQLATKVILCPKNEETLIINDDAIKRLSTKEKIYTSIDKAICESGDDPSLYPEEFLYSLTPNGLAPHRLILKTGAIIMLMRNLNIKAGLCNGTRMIVRRIHDHVLDCEIIGGDNKNARVLIPRITLTPNDPFLPFEFERHQFPIRLALAMTINKSQGQTFSKVGLYLREPVFSHGQLYVAFSRVRSLASIKVKIDYANTNKTKNIVFKEVL